MRPEDAKDWFGALPPDLSVIARARSSGAGSGADWLYTYLRSYYRDDTRPTGWNNLVFPNVGMPHVLWELQGARRTPRSIDKEEAARHGSRTGHVDATACAPRGSRSSSTHHARATSSQSSGTLSRVRQDRRRPGGLPQPGWREPRQRTRKRLGRLGAAVPGRVDRPRLAASTRAYWKDVK